MQRLGTDAKRHRVVQRGGSSSSSRMARMVPHSRVGDKNKDGYLGSKRSQSQTRLYSPGFQHQENKAS